MSFKREIINPFSGEQVTIYTDDYDSRKLSGMPWPEELVSELSGQYDTNAEWMAAAIDKLGPEQAGVIILGS